MSERQRGKQEYGARKRENKKEQGRLREPREVERQRGETERE